MTAPLCRVCLYESATMHDIKNTQLQEIYEKLSNTQLVVDDGRPETVCHTCYSQLLKCLAFSVLAQNADNMLTEFYRDGIEISSEKVAKLHDALVLINIKPSSRNEIKPADLEETSNVTVTVKEELDPVKDELLDIDEEYLNEDIKLEEEEPEEASNILNKEKSQSADVPRRDSTSSSSRSSSSGLSYYEDSDDSVKDPDYQIIRSKFRRIRNLFEEENVPANKTDLKVIETEVRLARDPVLDTANVPLGDMGVETKIGSRQQNECRENDDQLMNAIDCITSPSIFSNRLTPTQEIENIAPSTSGVTNTNDDPTPKKGKKRPIDADKWQKNVPITTAMSKKNKETNVSSMEDNRGCHGHQHKTDESVLRGVKEFINAIPKIESHYIRANTQRLYIDGSKNIADLHQDYVESCKEKDLDFVNYVMFYRIFTKDFNISFCTPKKDMCDVCEAYKNLSQEEKEVKREGYESHLKEKRLSRLEKEKDKNNKDLTVCVYGLQAVFQCPKGEISVFYYKSKLDVLNLTIYDIQKNAAECFVWDEAHADRGVNEIVTCVFKYIEKIASIGNDSNIVFYSDDSAGQQRNKFMIAMYLFAVQKFTNIKSITHKILIKGYTQNEVDSAHSQIERQVKKDLKKGPLYTPDAFINAIKDARKKNHPFRVNEMCYEDFYDWKNVCSQMNFQIQKDDENNVVKFCDLKVIRVEQDDERAIFFKKSYADEDFKRAIVINKRKEMNVDVKKAYAAKPGISKRKKADLMELVNKNLIPRYYRAFYESL